MDAKEHTVDAVCLSGHQEACVNAAGAYFIDEQPVLEKDLIKTLQENSKEKEGGLLIRAAENSTHGAVVKLMDMARSAGVFSISLVEE